ncbi:MAG TPA: metal ABC transporter permease [Candidatus Paceibacterota bacterium]|nr:metal ABC transporter permease [Candidatus Paceibacterota bacterium]
MIHPSLLQLVIGGFIGVGAGYVGAFMILRRMALVGDALSHVALPGLALALLLNFNPFYGAFATLFIAVIGVWALERKTSLSSETLVGIFFTTALALGILLTPEPELLEALFGDISKVTLSDAYITLPVVLGMIAIVAAISKTLVLGTISKELTQSMGLKVNRVNFLFLLLVALIVALGIKVTGTLLMGALVIIPATAARNISITFSRYAAAAAVFGGLTSIGGIWIAQQYALNPGPMVVLAGGIIFLISLFFKK